MRMTREELIVKFPSWNNAKHDIVPALYGDIPSRIWAIADMLKNCKKI